MNEEEDISYISQMREINPDIGESMTFLDAATRIHRAPQLWKSLVTSFCLANGELQEFEDMIRKFTFWKQILSDAHVTPSSGRDHLGGTRNVWISAHLTVMEVQICSISLYVIYCLLPEFTMEWIMR